MTTSLILTGAQRGLLVRIVAGNPPVRTTEGQLASSVYALRNRKLITTASNSSYWTAQPTGLGRALVERSPEKPTVVTAAQPFRLPVRTTGQVDVPDGSVPVAATVTAPALIDWLKLVGAPLVVENPNWDERRRWRRVLDVAMNSSAVPAGMTVRHSGRCEGTLRIWLTPIDHERSTAPVLTSLRRAHRLVEAVVSAKSENGWVDTRRIDACAHARGAKASVGRTARLLHSLVTEAVVRGYEVGQWSERHGCNGGLGIYINGHGAEVTVVEETDRIKHLPTRAELTRGERSPWFSVPTNSPQVAYAWRSAIPATAASWPRTANAGRSNSASALPSGSSKTTPRMPRSTVPVFSRRRMLVSRSAKALSKLPWSGTSPPNVRRHCSSWSGGTQLPAESGSSWSTPRPSSLDKACLGG